MGEELKRIFNRIEDKLDRLKKRDSQAEDAGDLRKQMQDLLQEVRPIRQDLEPASSPENFFSEEESRLIGDIIQELKQEQELDAWVGSPPASKPMQQQAQFGKSIVSDIADDPLALRWQRILPEHPRILILGAQGTGKSCLGFWLLEILRERGPCYVYRLPEEGKRFTPGWLGVIQELTDAPPGSIVLIDEGYLFFSSRDSQSRANKQIARLVNLARQRKLSLIFVAHESRHLDKNILSSIEVLILKKPAPLQVKLDRSILKPYLLRAQKSFQGKSDTSCKRISYVVDFKEFEGPIENPKASFWKEGLSHVFASGLGGEDEKPAKELSVEEKKQLARKRRDVYGHSYGKIAKDLGVGKTTVYRWLKNNKNGTNT